jgi:hypothetical protein
MPDLRRIHLVGSTSLAVAASITVPAGSSEGDILSVIDDGSGNLISSFVLPGAVSPIIRVPLILPDPGNSYTLTNMAAALTELERYPMDLRRVRQARLVGVVRVAGSTGSKLLLEWSPDEVVAFDELDAAAGQTLNLTATGRIRGPWAGVIDTARADVYVRLCSIGGDGAADPAVGPVFLELSGEEFAALVLSTTGMQHRFAADLITGLSNGSAVATWDDESGNNSDATQATGGLQPTYQTNVLNSLPVVRFASGKSMTFPRTIGDDFSIYVVFAGTGGANAGENFYDGAGLVQGEVGGITNDFGLSINANGKVLFGTGNPDRTIASSAGYNDGNTHIIRATRTRSTGTLSLWIDRVLIGTRSDGGTQTLNSPTNLTVAPEGMDIAEILDYNVAHSPGVGEMNEDYLFDKWVP